MEDNAERSRQRPVKSTTALGALLCLLAGGCAGLRQSDSPVQPPHFAQNDRSTTAERQRWSATDSAGEFQANRVSVPVEQASGSETVPPEYGLPTGRPAKATLRGQTPERPPQSVPGSDDYWRGPMPASDGTATPGSGSGPPTGPPTGPSYYAPPPAPTAGSPTAAGNGQWLTSPFINSAAQGTLPDSSQLPGTPVPVDVYVEEDRTGRFMFGAGLNSEAGVTGQIIVDERNFDLFRLPRNFSEIWNGEAFRGAGQGFRIEAIPGNQVQRYLVSFTEPYLLSTPVSLNVSGFLFDRFYYDWTESRIGGRVGLGYRLTPDLSVTGALRMENVEVRSPRVPGVAPLDAVLGNSDLYSGRVTVRHDTRDIPFAPTEGHLIEMSFEQVFGEYDYPRADVDLRRYFLIRERADGSGRHTLAFSLGAGFTGSQTPIFENYFAGGFSTLRGFQFRGASPVVNSVTTGGQFRMLGSVEYLMPLTADDMIKAVAFCDYGTVEPDIAIHGDDFRVAPGFGFRLSIPAMGPAPLAFDFAFPISKSATDRTRTFSFFFGYSRG